MAATLYFMLTGKTPIDAEKRVMTREDKLEPPNISNSNISNKVNQAILKGMERYPDDRPQTTQIWLNLLSQQHSESTEQQEYSEKPKIEIDENSITSQKSRKTSDRGEDINQLSPSFQTQELLLESTLTGFTYGLLTSPLARFIFASWIFVLWILLLVGLMFTQYRGVLNFISRQNRRFLIIIIISAFIVIILFFGNVTEKLTILAMTLFSTSLSFLVMLVIRYLGVSRSSR